MLSRPELVFDGAGRTRRSRSNWAAITRSRPRSALSPTPSSRLSFPVEAKPGIKNQSLHVEVYVPHSVPAGIIVAALTLSCPPSSGSLRLPVVLQVWDFTLPDHLSFLPEMNCYGLPENEREYYRLAHRHRTVLNRVPYSQSGQMHDGCAPRWDNGRLDFDWSAWDRRFGPLLDGSAFADLPRKSVPVECFYLPLHENWPSPMDGNYNGDYWADRAFPESYRRAFVAASRQIAAHVRAKGWTETLFQGFLNNKNNFKARGWSRGSSPWLLDEPANFQDYWALRYFARAFHEGINQADWTLAQGDAVARLAAAGLPRRYFAAAMAARQSRRPAGLPCGRQRDARLSAAGLRAQAGPGRNRAGVRLDQPGRRLERPAGRVVPGCLVAGGRRRHPLADGRQRRIVGAGRRAVALLSGAAGQPVGTGRGPAADSLDPAQGLSPRPAGRGVSGALVAGCATSRDGRSASRCARP